MTKRTKRRLVVLGVASLLLLAAAASQLPSIGSALILHPVRRNVISVPPPECHEVTFKGEGVSLRGWKGRAHGEGRGTVIYLHGFADNRASGAGVMERFRRSGFDVVAYDSRAHGESGGEASTFGFHEKEDLRRVMDTLEPGPVVLIGASLGAAVALQTAAVDPRISAVVAAETFSDLRTVITERAPFFFTADTVNSAIKLACEKGSFRTDEASPTLAARKITIPVLLIHGASDTATPPDHSRRVFENLAGPKRLIIVPGAGHNESLRGNTWDEIERWIETVPGASRSRD